MANAEEAQRPEAIRRWHRVVDAMRQGGDDSLLFDLLDEDAVFLSPVVHTPQQGRQLTFAYLSAATKVFARSQFRYAGEWYAERSAVLEFEAEIDGIQINGVDMIWWNDEQRITRFKVMVRPLKAVNLLHQMMAGQLQNAAG